MAEFTLKLTCPFCGTKERMRTALPPIKQYQGNTNRGWVPTPELGTATRYSTGAVCGECHEPFGVVLQVPVGGSSSTIFSLLQSTAPDAVDSVMHRLDVSTNPRLAQQVEFIRDLPERIRSPFQAAIEDAVRRRNAPGILAVCRGCLDVALKELGQPKGGRRERINNLAKDGTLTHGLAEWAQKLWDDGNDAVHDLDATIESAIDHVEFLKLFFEVAFALPERIKRASHGGVSPTTTGP